MCGHKAAFLSGFQRKQSTRTDLEKGDIKKDGRRGHAEKVPEKVEAEEVSRESANWETFEDDRDGLEGRRGRV